MRHRTRPFQTLALSAALALASAAPLAAQIADRVRLVAALDSAARAHVTHATVPGVSVAVVRGADTLLLRGYGVVDLEWDVPTPADATASYEIGSVTKQFTAAAAHLLAQEGALDLDADVTTYLPDFDTGGHHVPVRRLLDHTSGIKGYTEMAVFGEIVTRDLPRDSLVTLIERQPFVFEPGTAAIYNNSAYFLLGLVIEAVTGEAYEDVVRTRLFEPLGMTGSYYCSESAVREGRAHGYDAGPGGLRRAAWLHHRWPYAAGSLCSTAGDLVAWTRALHHGRVLGPAAYRDMITPRPLVDGSATVYAGGLGVGSHNGTQVIAHGGGINGFLSQATYVPEHDLTVVVLQNSTGAPPPQALDAALVELVLGPREDPPAVAFTGDLDALVGEYAGPTRGGDLHLEVARDGDALVLRRVGAEDDGGGDAARPAYLGEGVWRTPSGIRYRFVVADGRALELRRMQGMEHAVLRRVR